ncbi:MAG: GNAT family N-acetyltransferase [Clostridia bacterium]|nr:GNAT family N-acetyltransferase [Clostridia bacterium]
MKRKEYELEKQSLVIRKAEKSDLNRIKVIWKLCFEDENSYIDYYFDNRDWQNEMAVLLIDGNIVSMLTMIPVEINSKSGEKVKSAMLYAIATHPQYRKRGLADKLMDWSSSYLLSNEIPLTMLVPAEPELYKFYDGRGYTTECFIRETIMSSELIENIDDPNQEECRIYSAEPNQYNQTRRRILDGFSYVDYKDSEILYQKKASQLFNADIYIISIGEAEGCAIVERTDEKVIVKELLIAEKYLVPAIKELLVQMPASTYILRTPAFINGVIGGDIRPFGMIRLSCKLPGPAPRDIYLGIALD